MRLVFRSPIFVIPGVYPWRSVTPAWRVHVRRGHGADLSLGGEAAVWPMRVP